MLDKEREYGSFVLDWLGSTKVWIRNGQEFIKSCVREDGKRLFHGFRGINDSLVYIR